MTERGVTALALIKEREPSSEAGLLVGCGFTLTNIGSGAFRNVYALRGVPDFVIKVPNSKSGLEHARCEMVAYRRVMRSKKKYLAVQKYLPTILYWGSKSGVMVMQKYKVAYGRKHEKKIEPIRLMFEELFGNDDSDIWNSNVGTDADGNYKVIDLGLVIPGSA